MKQNLKECRAVESCLVVAQACHVPVKGQSAVAPNSVLGADITLVLSLGPTQRNLDFANTAPLSQMSW